jgi:hypothetical protein
LSGGSVADTGLINRFTLLSALQLEDARCCVIPLAGDSIRPRSRQEYATDIETKYVALNALNSLR